MSDDNAVGLYSLEGLLRMLNRTANISMPLRHIHLWATSLTASEMKIQLLKQTLSADELLKAEKFYFDKDRNQYIVRRGILRHIISAYLQLLPDKVNFKYNKYGKPSLAHSHSGGSLNFNLAHSNGNLLCGFALNAAIGVDLEYQRQEFPMNDIARRFFSPAESKAVNTAPDNSKMAVFYNIWARKEAYIKGCGLGLSIPLEKFNVLPSPLFPIVELAKGVNPDDQSWFVHNLKISKEYAAALAIKGRNWNISSPPHLWDEFIAE